MSKFGPGRQQSHYNQPGNPLTSSPNLSRAGTANPSGLIPNPNKPPMGPLAWSDRQGHRFQSDGTNQVWTWNTPVFDLRPGLSEAYGLIANAQPINHEGALGQAVYLVLTVGEATGTIPPALRGGMIAESWEVGSGLTALAPELHQLTQVIPQTHVLQAGGIVAVPPFVGTPASPFSFTPCQPALRFWQLYFRLTIPGVAPIVEPYFIQASLH